MIYHSHLIVKPSQNLAGTSWHTDGGFQHAKTPVAQPQEKPPASFIDLRAGKGDICLVVAA